MANPAPLADPAPFIERRASALRDHDAFSWRRSRWMAELVGGDCDADADGGADSARPSRSGELTAAQTTAQLRAFVKRAGAALDAGTDAHRAHVSRCEGEGARFAALLQAYEGMGEAEVAGRTRADGTFDAQMLLDLGYTAAELPAFAVRAPPCTSRSLDY